MESRTIELDGPVHFVVWDGPSDGPTFVCVHGLGGSHLNWWSVAPTLAKRGRVLAVDLAGFGRTPPAGRRSTIGANRRLLDRFIEATGSAPAILIGNSMGGLISALEAARSPEAVAGLILVDPAIPRTVGASADPVVAAAFAAYLVPGVGEQFLKRRARKLGPERIVRETMAMCAVDPSRIASEALDAHIALATERSRMAWGHKAFLEAARSLLRRLARREKLMSTFREITCPTLLLMGDRDRLVPIAAGRTVAAALPNWTFHEFADVGHIPQLEVPDQWLEVVEGWLEGAGRAAVAISRADRMRPSVVEASG